jgi:hypothetical protein
MVLTRAYPRVVATGNTVSSASDDADLRDDM